MLMDVFGTQCRAHQMPMAPAVPLVLPNLLRRGHFPDSDPT